jgi:hypothetical protein
MQYSLVAFFAGLAAAYHAPVGAPTGNAITAPLVQVSLLACRSKRNTALTVSDHPRWPALHHHVDCRLPQQGLPAPVEGPLHQRRLQPGHR